MTKPLSDSAEFNPVSSPKQIPNGPPSTPLLMSGYGLKGRAVSRRSRKHFRRRKDRFRRRRHCRRNGLTRHLMQRIMNFAHTWTKRDRSGLVHLSGDVGFGRPRRTVILQAIRPIATGFHGMEEETAR